MENKVSFFCFSPLGVLGQTNKQQQREKQQHKHKKTTKQHQQQQRVLLPNIKTKQHKLWPTCFLYQIVILVFS